MNAAQILDKVFDVYKQSFWKQLAYAAIVGVCAFLLMGIAMVFGVSIMAFAVTADFYVTGLHALVWIATVAAVIVLPAVLIWQGAASAGAILISREVFMGRGVRLPMYRLAGTIVRAVTALLAQVVASLPYIAAAGGVVFAFVRFAPYVEIIGALGYYIILVVLLLVALAGFFIYMHMFSLAIAVAVNERVWFFGALRRSASLIKGNFWRIFGVRAIWLVMISILLGAAQGILYALPMVSNLLVAGTAAAIPLMLLVNLIVGVGGMILTFAAQPLDGIIIAVIYFNQRTKKEGFDIEMRIEELHRAL